MDRARGWLQWLGSTLSVANPPTLPAVPPPPAELELNSTSVTWRKARPGSIENAGGWSRQTHRRFDHSTREAVRALFLAARAYLPRELIERIAELVPVAPANFTVATFRQPGGWTTGPQPSTASEALWIDPYSVVATADEHLLVIDSGNNRICEITPTGRHLRVCGSGVHGHRDGSAAAAMFAFPRDLAITSTGGLVVADGHCIRTVEARTRDVSTIGPYRYDALPFKLPQGVAVGNRGQIYVADTYNDRLRVLSADAALAAPAMVLAGAAGEPGYIDGPLSQARFSRPRSVVVDRDGGLLVADALNHCIRHVCLDTRTVSTVAGTGVAGFCDGFGDTSQFREPSGIAIDGVGSIVVADRGNHAIRIIRRRGTTATVSTLAGGPDAVALAGADPFISPSAVAITSSGAVVVADSSADRIRRVEPALRTFRIDD